MFLKSLIVFIISGLVSSSKVATSTSGMSSSVLCLNKWITHSLFEAYGQNEACPTPYHGRSLIPRQSTAGTELNFNGSKWIWTDELDNNGLAVTPSNRAFRKAFAAPDGKTPSTLKIAFAVDNVATLFVNGEQIGTNDNWHTASTYCVPLKPCSNVIAFNATNKNDTVAPRNHAALLVTGEITYTDGSTSRVISDQSWHVFGLSGASIPNGWESPSFDDSSWDLAISEGTFPNQDPDNYGSPIIAGTDPLSMSPASWIWTNEITAPASPVSPGTRAFRRTIELPPGHTSASAQVLIVADNEYSLYVNGRFVGTGTDWHTAQRFNIDNIQGPRVAVAIYAVNTKDARDASPAGLLTSMQIVSSNPDLCLSNCTSSTYLVTNGDWKANNSVPSGFEQPGFDDSTWSLATTEGTFGSSHWAPRPSVPSSISPAGTPLPSAPAGN
ncbi:hypothetical protein VKT23_010738 [Stygiomarasmius scandens]|uniref:Lectin n=1 Tax=Marasmiellus scandens TaxID=2682957 RepID=A0ABR1JDS8_9AGAR